MAYDPNMNGKPQGQMPPPPPAEMAGYNAARGRFLNGLCVCCSDCDSCLEAYCCWRCQMSRQCNMMKNGQPEIDWLYCMGAFCVDYFCTGDLAGTIFACQAREMIRRRYGIPGSACNDCCCAFWCTWCVIQQQLLEMTARGEFPGACCYEAHAASPAATQMY